MATFKTGEKVVFIGLEGYEKCPLMIFPSKHEIVTLNEFREEIGYWSIHEYGQTKDKRNQWFRKDCFRKLDYEFVEKVLTAIQPKKKVVTNYKSI